MASAVSTSSARALGREVGVAVIELHQEVAGGRQEQCTFGEQNDRQRDDGGVTENRSTGQHSLFNLTKPLICMFPHENLLAVDSKLPLS